MPTNYPALAEIVKSHLTHSRVVLAFQILRVYEMEDARKSIQSGTEDSYPEYARPNNGVTWMNAYGWFTLENRWLVPYNPYPTMKFNSHINVEVARGVHAINGSRPNTFFVQGPAGTGKTFLYKTLCSYYRSQCKIVLCVASSGISALLPNGKAAHSMFQIPIECTDESTCCISGQSHLASLIKNTALIILDEVTMQLKKIFGAVHRTLQDLTAADNSVFRDCAILTSRNYDVDRFNREIAQLRTIESHEYFAVDQVHSDEAGQITDYPTEYLQSLAGSGLPHGALKFQMGMPVMLLPLRPSYSMTSKKSQGQTLQRGGVDLSVSVFKNGQFYAALSRETDVNNLIVLLPNGTRSSNTVVYSELLLQPIITRQEEIQL
ncbi:hypothetical protein EPUL_005244 [Erysiphe pulchra]|uniref:ATP-dependent DNA helicase n=1 Tax=Erysiphe pulchra TaxID=225359 RepID=A0A2S4PPJ7_9PEZI|nr:hypothetical protein EPUL_005244 [Erysiphe pulchra]